MIVFFLSTNKSKENLGELLMEYFEFFGKKYDFTRSGIDLDKKKYTFIFKTVL
jgi:DNA polymerase sigma